MSKIDGMVLFGAYPDTADRLAGTSLPVLSLYATNDGLTTLPKSNHTRTCCRQMRIIMK